MIAEAVPSGAHARRALRDVRDRVLDAPRTHRRGRGRPGRSSSSSPRRREHGSTSPPRSRSGIGRAVPQQLRAGRPATASLRATRRSIRSATPASTSTTRPASSTSSPRSTASELPCSSVMTCASPTSSGRSRRMSDLYLVPANWPGHAARALAHAAPCPGDREPGLRRRGESGRAAPEASTYVGDSAIMDPMGRVLAEGGADEEVLVADVDARVVAQVRQEFPFLPTVADPHSPRVRSPDQRSHRG